MYDIWTSWLSEELLAQAVRVDGVLYLPAYGLAGELFQLVFPWFVLCVVVVPLLTFIWVVSEK